jgi:hypothetical protein
MTRKTLWHPFGVVEYPDGYVLRVVEARRGWERKLPNGTVVVKFTEAPFFGLVALVAIPPEGRPSQVGMPVEWWTDGPIDD